MDWQSLTLSLKLAVSTVLVLLPFGVFVGRWLASSGFLGKSLVQSLVVLPLVLPPTVLGYYLLSIFAESSPIGYTLKLLVGEQIAFSFKGLLLASCILNAPLIIQPIHRAFENIPVNLRDAGLVSGLMPWQIFWKIELPLVWSGLVSGVILSFIHTLGEFGVVLMIGGSIPGETKTIAISIYDKVQAFDLNSANQMSLTLLIISTLAVMISFFISNSLDKR